MGKYVKWIEYKGENILFLNQKGLDEENIVNSFKEAKHEISNYKSELLLVITDVTDTYITNETKEKGKEFTKFIKESGKKDLTAIVGVKGAKKVIISSLNKDLYFPNTMEDAKEWLINKKKQLK